MIKIEDIAFTAYPVTDIQVSRHFYEDLLGLKVAVNFGDAHKAWIEYNLPSGTLAISNMAEAWSPSSSGPSIAFEVEDLNETMAFLKEKDVSIITEPFESPICTIAIISDPDGNLITIHKKKASHPDHPPA